jgi:UPF0755 protein
VFGLKRYGAWLAAGLAICGIAIGATLWAVNHTLDSPLEVPAPGIAFDIKPGAAFVTVSSDLEAANILRSSTVLNWYARLSGQAQSIHAGEYFIESGSTARSVLGKFVAGDVKLHAFTIVEGWTYRELVDALANNSAVKTTMVFEDWPAFLESLSDKYDHPEGLFLPETYLFPKYSKDIEVLRQAYDAMQAVLTKEWDGRDVNLPLKSPYEALILASIIEKETALAGERPRISGVFVRRMQQGMRLQTDPTVIYGIGDEFDGNLTRKHMRTDTRYNTYTRHGLPPTPIALPGQAAIAAALHPQSGNEVYFVASALGDGSHAFSVTKEQHDTAVREYLARQRANRNQGK